MAPGIFGIVNLTPQADTVAEVRVAAATFSAEKGRASGALIEVYTKSGTNDIHGTIVLAHKQCPYQPHGFPDRNSGFSQK